jgi:subtilisin family serine protease
MKAVIVCIVIVLLVLPSSAYVNDLIEKQPTRAVRAIRVPFHPPPPTMWYVPNQMVVKLHMGVNEVSISNKAVDTQAENNSLAELNRKYKVNRFERQFPKSTAESIAAISPDLGRYFIVEFGEEFTLKQVMNAYKINEYVERVEAIGCHAIMEMIPNDPYFLSDQWNFYDDNDNDVDATDAWDLETGDTDIILGDLDTGLQYNSRDLGGLSPYTDGNVWINYPEYNGTTGVDDDGNGYMDDWVGWDFVHGVSVWPGEDGSTPDNEPTDFNGHGTHVGGIMGAITNNGVMVAGLAGGWNAGSSTPANGVKIMACRIGWSASYMGQEVGYVRMDFAAQAIYYAVNKGVTAINCSWGSSNSGGLGAAVDYAIANGVVIVHAAGNDGNSYADYLGSRTDVLNVAATDSTDTKASFSNYGTWVDLAAPGVDVLSTYSYHYNPNYIAWVSGTSQAAPHVTAAAGLLKSYDNSLTWSDIMDLIVDYTDNIDEQNPGYEGLLGSGRLNVFKSLDAVIAPSVTVIQPNGGEVLYIGQEYEVMWDAYDNVGIDSSVIDYSVDSGENWTHIATVMGNPESYIWTVCGPPSTHCRMRVTCYDAVGLSGSDMSDEDFCPPYMTLADGRPVGGRGFAIQGTEQEPTVPEYRFALLQNYPNPFNPSTQIKYSLRERCRVRLAVFNVLGQKVATLVDEVQKAGEKSVTWNAAGLTSGMYFYRLEAGNFIQTKKMVLMR